MIAFCSIPFCEEIKMGAICMLLKNITLLFLLISASLLSSSFAGRRHWEFARHSAKASPDQEAEAEAGVREKGGRPSGDDEEGVKVIIHERLLRANMRDYGRYDPAPTMNKPPFKLIPN